MTTGSLSPLSEEFSAQLRDQLRRLLLHFDEMRALAPAPGAWLPPVDLCEMKDAVLVRVELPGVAMADVRVSLLDSVLKIEGRKERPAPGKDAGGAEKPLRFLCLERSYGAFTRRVSLKWMVDVEQVSARLVNGILEVRLPKARSCGREIVIPIDESRAQ
jgi:HSP20 family protein